MMHLRDLIWRNPSAGIAPETPVWVVGDIHGRIDLLDRLLPRIGAGTLVFTGDYVDRGPASRQVIARLRGLSRPAIFLKGNHEAMLLDFLDNPADACVWLRHGGLATLASYGISGITALSDRAARVAVRDQLLNAFSGGEEAFLRGLTHSYMNGNIHISHAGADPDKPLEKQVDWDILWGHENLLTCPRRDGFWVVHGHIVTQFAYVRSGRVNVDTGAWFSGRLSATHIRRDRVSFIHASIV